MRVIDKNISDLIPYKNNPRHNEDAIPYVMNSIKEFGFKVPIVIDTNNVIVTGHTRLEASKRLGLKKVPCIIADDLTADQIQAFRIADNKVSEFATWDEDKLNIELDNIELDMSEFGIEFEPLEEFEPFEDEETDDDGYYGDERERTNDSYNLALIDYNRLTNDFWQMPTIMNNRVIPTDLIGFNYAKTSKTKDVGIHFYVDDYQFERVWNRPEQYAEILKEYQCVLSPDFSLYMDMPMPMKIWNIYRSRQMGAFWQGQGINVIPTISWAEEDTFQFAFKGIPKGSTISISTIGVKRYADAMKIWTDGMDEMIRQIEPETIIVYGGKLEYEYPTGTNVLYFENKVTERMNDSRGEKDNGD